MQLDQIKRREFITLLGGAAAWPLDARAQQADQTRRIGVLTVFSKDDPEGQRRVTALQQRLQELGWVDGRNVRMELRWAGSDPDRARFYAGELVGMKPDVIVINHALVLPLLRQETHTIPIETAFDRGQRETRQDLEARESTLALAARRRRDGCHPICAPARHEAALARTSDGPSADQGGCRCTCQQDCTDGLGHDGARRAVQGAEAAAGGLAVNSRRKS